MSVAPLRFVFVIGCQRSGTTLTGQILGAHPNAVLLDEPDGIYPWFAALDPKDPFGGDGLSAVLEKAATKYADPEQRFCRDKNGAMSLLPQVRTLVLKAPNLTFSRAGITALKADKRVVSVIRNPEDVVASMARLSHIPMVENQLQRMRDMADLPAWAAQDLPRLGDEDVPVNERRALVWKIKNGLADEFRALGPAYWQIAYEELVRSPEAIMPLLCRHVQLGNNPNLLQHEKVFVGTGPGKTRRTRGIDTASLSSAQSALNDAARGAILAAAGPRADRYRRAAPVRLNQVQPPLILLGRGGSGTRLLSQIFHDAGVFLGSMLNVSNDSIEWVETLYSGLSRKLQRTMDPAVLAVPELKTELHETACRVLERSDYARFEEISWGWKLPETMILVPEVLHAFPEARVIQIVRHPVTSSLRRTHKTSRADDEVGRYVLAAARKQVEVPLSHGLDADTLNNVLSWHLQVSSVTRICRDRLPASRYLELRYEDLFSDWPTVQGKLARFAGLAQSRMVMPPLDTSRRQAFQLPDDRIEEVWRMTREVAELHGYCLDETGAPGELALK